MEQNADYIRPVNGLVEGKLESKVAYTTFWLTVFVAVSGVPIQVVYLFRGVLPMSKTPASTRFVNKQKRLDSAGNLVANLTGSGNPQLKRLPEVKLMDVGDYKVVDDASRLVSTCVDSTQ